MEKQHTSSLWGIKQEGENNEEKKKKKKQGTCCYLLSNAY